MPSLPQLLSDPVSLTMFSIYAVLMLWEAAMPARPLPRVRGWRLRGALAFALYFLMSSYLPLLWGEWLAQYTLFDLGAWPTWAAVAIGLLCYEAGVYAWHRTMHGSNLLWRMFHQMHHSAERLDTSGAFWFSPVDMFGWIALASLCLVVIVGVPPAAAVVVGYITLFLAVFQHTNVRTPRWLGVLVQRPESHSVHHQRGVHAFNYCDLPVFDLVFGTLRNPRDFAPEQGLFPGASSRLADLLLMRDVAADGSKRQDPAAVASR